jgi:hypothetical protein
MIVMLGDKDGQVDQPHGGPQARMERGALEHCRIHGQKKRDELASEIAKLREEIVQATRIVIGFVRTTVGQVSGFQFDCTVNDLSCPAMPQRFEVDEVADILLH